MFALGAHVYPTAVRATGVAWAASVGRVGGLISSLFGAAIIGAGAPAYWGALAVANVCAFAGLFWVRSHFSGVNKR
jgi:AAHS family 4-hydroxybenzoate transporter-like MFS transporter